MKIFMILLQRFPYHGQWVQMQYDSGDIQLYTGYDQQNQALRLARKYVFQNLIGNLRIKIPAKLLKYATNIGLLHVILEFQALFYI